MAAKKGPAGTPALRVVEESGRPYTVHEFEHLPGGRDYGMEAAVALGVEPERVFKTLLTTVDGEPAVAIVPVTAQLSLKLLAAAVDGKRAEMMKPEAAERLTGYVVGGISPLGQKRASRTVVDETAVLYDTVFVSGGRRGLDLELAPDDLVVLVGGVYAPIAAG